MQIPLAVSLAIVTGSLSAQDGPPPRIEWCEDLAAAKAQSKKDGRPVVAYFTFDT